MSSITLPLCLFLLILSTSSPSITSLESDSDSPTVYEILQEYNFPVGLLPKSVTRYEFDRTTGNFAVYLNKSCSFSISGYTLKYMSKVTGKISKNRLSNLKGVQVKLLLFWINIVEVTRDGDDIDFSVGIASADFGVENFYESPQCGCGFDCVNSEEYGYGEFNLKKLISSF
ncbi:hypothetical protein BC332_07061 [Capsicum chinense]|uniref:DUF538 domain-containing protein n=1 Tax=Capsicum annuum TaxID=4072 RepID=A0A1U8G3R1_CAPAN|nr:uncharacterized protein At5g01610-like [Capsicum annuum]KAF3684609.1 putative exocyst complex component SEC15B-like isoform X1 [Capsicum annuum]PHT86123.1 hypothetical protein T459_08229 [Capsicum annuum]PHU21954.1 hypothetical protein BC332_07061 [Capsicum chinense]